MDIQERIATFVALSEQMLELAKSGDWEEVTRLESGRRPDLEAFLNSLDESARRSHTELLQQSIERILSIDNEIMALGHSFKEDALKSLQQNQVARKATAAYQKNKTL